MPLISWIGWKLTPEKTQLIERMMNYFGNCMQKEDLVLAQTSNFETVDAASYDNPGDGADYIVVFGKTAQGNLSNNIGQVFYLPDLDKLMPTKENAANRTAAMADLAAAASQIVSVEHNKSQEREEKVIAAVVTEEEVMVGKEETDIIISQQEVNYLLQIKSLLGGHFKKIRLTKGDIVIEVEE